MTEKRLQILVERDTRSIGIMELGIDQHRIPLVDELNGPQLDVPLPSATRHLHSKALKPSQQIS